MPRKLLIAKAEELYKDYTDQLLPEIVPESEKLRFSNKWVKGWMIEYGVSLRKPNKRFAIKNEDRIERLSEHIKNLLWVRKYFLDNFGYDPLIINGDQMPLHRNESSSQKTLNMKNEDTFVKVILLVKF